MPLALVRHAQHARDRFAALPPNLAASVLVLCSFAIFTWMGVLARVAGQSLPVVEIVFLRQIIAMGLMAPIFLRVWPEIRRPQKPAMHLLRGVAASVAMVCGISAVVFIPFADATAIQMAEVLFITALAALVLKENIGWRRWSATAVGLVGVVVMLRPFGDGLNLYGLIALLGAFAGGVTAIALRLGAAYDKTPVVLFYQGLVVLALLLPFAVSVAVVPTLPALATVLLMSVIFVIGQWLFTAALRMGGAAALAPLHYVRLLMMAVIGYLLYGEVPTLATVAGAVLVVGAATYTLRRNAIRETPASPPSEAG